MHDRNSGRSQVLGPHFHSSPNRLQNLDSITTIVRHFLQPSLVVVVCTLIIFATSGSSFGQGPQVVTTDAGVQFDGKVFDIQAISESASVYEPYQRDAAIVVVDDGYRRIFLNPEHVLPTFGESDRLRGEIEFEISQKVFNPSGSNGGGDFLRVTQFDIHGHRTLTVRTTKGIKTFVQGITKITPRYVVVETLVGGKAPARWTMHLARGTVPKDVLRNVLHKRIKKPNRPEEYFDIALFWQQIGDFDQASLELLAVESKFPDLKERIDGLRQELGQLRAKQILREINTRLNVGQSKLASDFATAMLKFSAQGGLAGETLAALRDVEDQRLIAVEALETKRKKVMGLIENIKNVDADQVAVIDQFRNELETELSLSNVNRLDGYLRLAEDATTPDGSKMALAISGWVTGSNNAINNLAIAQGMFKVRSLVREYLTTATTKLRRSRILNELEMEAGTPPIIAAMLKQMLPIDPPEGMKTSRELEKYAPVKPISFSVEIPGTLANPKPRSYQCLAHVPPQYDHYRNYPLILSMPGGKQTLQQHLNMWCGSYNSALNVRNGHAMRHGYIVVAVDWRDPGQSRWGYSLREHGIVIKALKESLRKFSVDSDRVFLSGHGIGGDGAYDIGIAHPEHWAGVLGFSGSFDKYINVYKSNKHVQLPMYCVNGSKHFGAIGASKDVQNKWIRNKGYPDLTVIHYIGRANELFIEEIPEAFKWMKPQKRFWPGNVGFEFECDSMRRGDCYYWFLEMDETPESFVVRPELFDITKLKKKLTYKGKILEPNVFRIEPKSRSIKNKTTIWLAPEWADFTINFEIRGRDSFKGPIVPSREVLLNDVRRRADREHPFWGKIVLEDGKKWTANTAKADDN